MAELTTLARPYAKAAFQAAESSGDLAGWSAMLVNMATVASQDKVVELISTPALTAEQKAQQFTALFSGELSNQAVNLIGVLSENHRLGLLPQIQQIFEELKAQRERSVDVELISAYELPQETQQSLVSALTAKLNREIVLTTTTDQSLLGGAVIRAGDTVIDGSVRGRLAKLAEAMNS